MCWFIATNLKVKEVVLVFKRATYAYYALSRAAPEKRTISMIGTAKTFNKKKITM